MRFLRSSVFVLLLAGTRLCQDASTRAIRGTVVDASGGRVPESDISSFAHKSRTPEEQQTSMSMEREVGNRIAVGISYIFVHA
jgi:hypothetical protein